MQLIPPPIPFPPSPQCPVKPEVRSLMNIPFTLPSEELDGALIKEAAGRGLIQLKGHRSVGGLRASVYNALPIEGAQALADLMKEFAAKNKTV